MPQLDTVTYLSQLVWTFLIFAVFYAMMVKHILPAISTSIKVRKKKLQHNSNLIAGLEEEEVATAFANSKLSFVEIRRFGVCIDLFE